MIIHCCAILNTFPFSLLAKKVLNLIRLIAQKIQNVAPQFLIIVNKLYLIIPCLFSMYVSQLIMYSKLNIITEMLIEKLLCAKSEKK